MVGGSKYARGLEREKGEEEAEIHTFPAEIEFNELKGDLAGKAKKFFVPISEF